MEQKQWGITQLYNEYFHEPASKLYQLHQQLDKLVMKAYGFKTNDDILAKLLELNLELAEKENRGEKVIGAESPYGNEVTNKELLKNQKIKDAQDVVDEYQSLKDEVAELQKALEKEQEKAIGAESLID